MRGEYVILKRDCEAIQIPSGYPVSLGEGAEVQITQELGGTFTVITSNGIMATVQGKDADALGKEPPKDIEEIQNANTPIEDRVWAMLKTCYDPEIPHNIVDLGLIYDCKISHLETGNGYRVEIKMTLTAPGCGMGDYLKQDAYGKLMSLPDVKQVIVDMVFDPPWSPEMMSKPLRRQLNF